MGMVSLEPLGIRIPGLINVSNMISILMSRKGLCTAMLTHRTICEGCHSIHTVDIFLAKPTLVSSALVAMATDVFNEV